ncbi:hypothetical protein X773_26715 [Mesorhizobium sp. LSJC285A00]|nr:hypothetical protein X771_11920 [Mesorhizobium sp. LSJC277A00]ESW74446.1 hypothetical protein X773_26715 [Mesorhizobium sp. LSJC285A00]ESX08262.1 hypothetical protein X768_23645 [Mesorhizobium sp. LSJC265A00]ESX25119.1 hypothetical protein X767_10655 [Mesorhizobium sp. LSJC264A00]ESX91802.1 hypothetical protein X754_23045 [Mesorhizobium sp. LNJC403B00]ESX97731.1 hypothetical protein X755_20300 [Mesorhizobium sp. LNJC405B00]ESY03872.1 hypothetical protein X753_21100 [Mesorhizobium sp. LNJC3
MKTGVAWQYTYGLAGAARSSRAGQLGGWANAKILTAPRFLLQRGVMFVFSFAIAKRRRSCTTQRGKLFARRKGPAQ